MKKTIVLSGWGLLLSVTIQIERSQLTILSEDGSVIDQVWESRSKLKHNNKT